MAAKGSGQQRKLGAIEPDAVGRGLANRVVDRMVPSGPSDFEGWTAGDVSRWLNVQAESFREIRGFIGLALWVLRERCTESAYTAEVKRIAAAYDVHVGTLWRWRHQAEEKYGLGVPEPAKLRSSAGRTGNDAKGLARETRALAAPALDPDGVTSGGVVDPSPQEPPPDDGLVTDIPSPDSEPPSTGLRNAKSASVDPSPPVAAVLGTGSPPPERTTPPADPGRVGVRGFDAPPGGEPRPASSSGAAIRVALDLLAKTSVEELRAAGHARLRDAADRLAEADGRKLVTLHEWAETRAELRRHREAPTVPSKAPRAGKATAVASGGRSGGKTPTTPPTSNPTGVCTHPPARWNRLAYGVFCGVEGCGAKVR